MTRLKVRAPQTGQSLQEYLLELTTCEARQPVLAETAERTQRYARALRVVLDNDANALESHRESVVELATRLVAMRNISTESKPYPTIRPRAGFEWSAG